MFVLPNTFKWHQKSFRRIVCRTAVAIFLCVLRINAADREIASSDKKPAVDLKSAVVVDTKPTVAPPAEWVVPLPFARLSNQGRINSGDEQRWLLRDRQINVRENETFFHSVRQILTSSGVQNHSQISIDFDPTYETLTLNWVRLWRGTNLLDRLDPAKIKVIQQERDLDRYTVNGEQSAIFLLEDVRVGDIVDYAWTIRGANPIFGGKFFGAVEAQYSSPVERISTRLLWPGKTQLHTRNHGTTVKPVIVRNTNYFEFKWDFKNVPGLQFEDSLPSWYDPAPWIQLSEFASWADVNQWAVGLFQCSEPISSELSQKINLWRRIPNKEEQILAALQFVQNDVRYLGIEMGENSHRPSDPSTVFTRRFGDCKDKTFLFVTILRALGVEAWPVLVNTELLQTIDEWHPSPFAFDHVIAQVQLGRQIYWLDATMNFQSGSLAAHNPPNYERGLVVRPGTRGLTAIPQSAPPKTTVAEYFTVRGKTEPADLKVVTIAEGADAERLRAQFATTSREEIGKTYLNFYAPLYPGIRPAGPIVFSDDSRQNKIQITESYVIDGFWRLNSEDRSFRCQFSPYNIEGFVGKPAISFRRMPLGLRYPEHQIFRAEISLPQAWQVKPRTKVVDDRAFYFRSDVSISGRKVFLDYEYRGLADSVEAANMPDYIRHLDDVNQSLGEVLLWR